MPEEVLFGFERSMDRAAIADYLRTVADRLESGESLSFEAGDESATVTPPANPTFEVKVERETDGGDSSELGVEFELEWEEGARATDRSDRELQIE